MVFWFRVFDAETRGAHEEPSLFNKSMEDLNELADWSLGAFLFRLGRAKLALAQDVPFQLTKHSNPLRVAGAVFGGR